MPGTPACPDEPLCRATESRPRHCHQLVQLNGIGEDCWTCRKSDWTIWFGGSLPALIRCNGCGAGFNLSARLRDTTMPGKRERALI